VEFFERPPPPSPWISEPGRIYQFRDVERRICSPMTKMDSSPTKAT
jgi:hypothetical protein